MKQIYSQALFIIGLAGLSGIFIVFNEYYPSVYLEKTADTLLLLLAIMGIFRFILPALITHRITDPKSRYSIKKILNISGVVIFFTLTAFIWIEESTSLLVTSSIIGAGIAFSLQDVIKNFVGALILLLSELYRIGDRIEIDGNIGDVIDIGIMNTVIMEVRGWVSGDQVSGRLIAIPNAYVINRPIVNYTRDHSFIWDEISLPLTYDSNWQLACTVIENIIREEIKSVIPVAEDEINSLGMKYFVLARSIEPKVYMSLTDNWIQFDARYICDARNRRQTKNEITLKIMKWIESCDDVHISSTTSTITIKQ